MLTDDDIMPISTMFKDQPLKNVPAWYWRWFVKQTHWKDWNTKHADLIQYAKRRIEDDNDLVPIETP